MTDYIEAKSKKTVISIYLVTTTLGIIMIVTSIVFPWWTRIDSTVGPLRLLYLYQIANRTPFKNNQYFWDITTGALRNTLMMPLTLLILSLIFSFMSLMDKYVRKGKFVFYLSIFSGFLTGSAVIAFKTLLENYYSSIGETVKGSLGFMNWGYGMGWKLAIIASVFLIISGLSEFFDLGDIEIEIESEEPTANE